MLHRTGCDDDDHEEREGGRSGGCRILPSYLLLLPRRCRCRGPSPHCARSSSLAAAAGRSGSGGDRDRARCEQNRHETGRKATGGETEPPLRRSLPVVQGDGSGCRLAAEPYTTDACVHGSSWSRPRRCFDDACICRLPMPCPRRPSPSRTNEPNAGRRRGKKGTG